jgi:type I restriction enzyme, S subunit
VIDGLKPYPKMKDSGVPWLGDVPEHWECRRNGTIFVQRNETGFADLPILEVSLKTGVRVRDFELSNRKQVMSDGAKYKRACKGDIAYNMMRLWQGAVGIAPLDGLVSPAYIVARPLRDTDSQYYEYLFRVGSYMDEVNKFSRGIVSDRNRLYWEDFKQMPSPFPPHEEQVAISRFLQCADGRFRRYIGAKQKLIKLLEQQKQATIRRAVTRGLDPNVRLKPLGSSPRVEVNANWRIARLWETSRVRSEKNRTDLELLSVFLGRGVIPYGEGGGQVHKPSLDLADYQVVHRGDLVLNNQQAWRGSIGVSRHRGIVSPAYLVLKLTNLLDPRYANYLFQSGVMVDQFVTSSKGVGDIQRDIHIPWLKNVRIPIPHIDEQQAVAVALDAELADIARQVSLLERGVALLREYSAGVNADVVTGKLDVREAAARLPEVSAELDLAPMESEMEPDEELEGETAGVVE